MNAQMLKHLIETVTDFEARGNGLRGPTERIDTTTRAGSSSTTSSVRSPTWSAMRERTRVGMPGPGPGDSWVGGRRSSTPSSWHWRSDSTAREASASPRSAKRSESLATRCAGI